MTEYEVIEWLRKMQNPMISEAELYCAETCYGLGKMVYPEPEDYVFETAIQALEEIQQYRTIGKVEEIKYLVDSYNGMIHDFGDDMSALEQYRAIGTVEGYENAIKAYTETYILMKEYKSKLQDFEAIGTIDEFKALKEKNTPMKHHHTRIDNISDEIRVSVCPNCLSIMYTHSEEYPVFCNTCGQKLDWQ